MDTTVVKERTEDRAMNGLAERYGLRLYLGILPGWDWLEEHEHDLDDYSPEFEISRPGFKTTFRLKDPKVMKEVAKVVMR